MHVSKNIYGSPTLSKSGRLLHAYPTRPLSYFQFGWRECPCSRRLPTVLWLFDNNHNEYKYLNMILQFNWRLTRFIDNNNCLPPVRFSQLVVNKMLLFHLCTTLLCYFFFTSWSLKSFACASQHLKILRSAWWKLKRSFHCHRKICCKYVSKPNFYKTFYMLFRHLCLRIDSYIYYHKFDKLQNTE